MDLGIIPARMGSTRFPGKPLANIRGVPMVGHVHLRSQMSDRLDLVVTATCDEEIRDYVESIGGRAVMTSDTHERASDRASEAMLKVEESEGVSVDSAVMIQGDEPLVRPEMIDHALEALHQDPAHIVNLVGPLETAEEKENPNYVKVVTDPDGYALYYSRAPIPVVKDEEAFTARKQVPIIPFERDFLLEFTELDQTPLERTESVDMLRVLEHGHEVKTVETEYPVQSVDIPRDVDRAEALLGEDPLLDEYREKARIPDVGGN